MKNIKKILVPTDFSETAGNAFRYALWFADYYNAEIEIVHVVFPEVEAMDLPVMVAQTAKIRVDLAKEIMKSFVENGLVKAQAGYQFQNTPKINSEVQIGSAASVIAELAEHDDIDLIIMGTHGEHNAFDKTFGSVTSNTMNRVDCPLLAIPDNFTHDELSILIYATDLSEATPYQIWETCKVLQPFSPILRIVHIKEGSEEKTALDMDDLKAFFTENAPAIQVTFHTFGSDDIPHELNDFSEAWGGDMLIMHRPKRGFFERLFHKSVSREMALSSKFPLLITR